MNIQQEYQKLIKLSNKGSEVYEKNPVQAIDYFKRAYNIYKKIGQINLDLEDQLLYNLGIAHYSANLFKEAIPYYKKLRDSHHIGKYELALVNFHLKNIDEGKKYYFHRYYKETYDAPKFPPIPLKNVYDSKDLSNEDVLVLNEQGLGDEILFMRGIPELAKKVKSLTVQVYPELYELFKNNIKLDNVKFFTERSFNISFVEQFSSWIPLGDVWTSHIDSKPLSFENKSVDLKLDSDKIHIGFVRSPNKKSKNSNDREFNEKYLLEIKEKYPQIELHNLSISEDYSYTKNYKENIKNINDTLGIANNMDLVITCDTSIAHLIGNSNIPMILVYNQYLDWRWTNNFYTEENCNIVQQKKLLPFIEEKLNLNKKNKMTMN